ncbi:hypothetical protein [Bradyrhizobium sp. 142]|uniref:hypothetical protein n=1 Tax=Bradyrhizobium sp. 142 TaxID=2782618 RepID=UPI001FF76D9F|nr:hypothetical protein [Bradyrhizobium sp. 142]MCK1724728.1 hypothetical protein [Bradyrhizobium sp. 142]
MTQRELDFLVGLKTGWLRLYRREFARLLRGEVGPGEAQPDARLVLWREVSS